MIGYHVMHVFVLTVILYDIDDELHLLLKCPCLSVCMCKLKELSEK